jgi:hypothetical protein
MHVELPGAGDYLTLAAQRIVAAPGMLHAGSAGKSTMLLHCGRVADLLSHQQTGLRLLVLTVQLWAHSSVASLEPVFAVTSFVRSLKSGATERQRSEPFNEQRGLIARWSAIAFGVCDSQQWRESGTSKPVSSCTCFHVRAAAKSHNLLVVHTHRCGECRFGCCPAADRLRG